MFLLLIFLISQSEPNETFLLITSVHTPIETISKYDLRGLFLGKRSQIRGITFYPIQVKDTNPTRSAFENWIFGPSFDLDEYWILTKLKGGKGPPLTVNGWGLVKAFTAKNPGYIGYIPRDQGERLTDLKIVRIE